MPYEHRFRTGRFRDINLGSDRVGVNFRPSGNRRVNAQGYGVAEPYCNRCLRAHAYRRLQGFIPS